MQNEIEWQAKIHLGTEIFTAKGTRKRLQTLGFLVWSFLTKDNRLCQSFPLSEKLPKLPDPGINPGSPALQVDSLPAELPEKPEDVQQYIQWNITQPLKMK